MVRLLLLLSLWLSAASAVAQPTTYFPVPPRDPGVPSVPNDAPNGAVFFHRGLFLYTAADLATGQLPASAVVGSLGFFISTPATAPAIGRMRLWAVPTLDRRLLRSPHWDSLLAFPTPMRLLYDSLLTIPAQAGWYDLRFNQPNATLSAAPGAGYYIAYEWQGAVLAPASPTYSCNPASLSSRTAVGTTSPPSVLGPISSYRPWIRLGVPHFPPFADPALLAIRTLGRLPLLDSIAFPHHVEVLVTNNGTRTAGPASIGLQIYGPFPASGSSSFNTGITLDSLRPRDTVWVRFPAYYPTQLGHYSVEALMVPPDDSLLANNLITDSLFVSDHEWTYGKGTGALRTGWAGFNAGGGTLLTRYVAQRPATVPSLRIGMGNFRPNIGRSVFAVLLDSTGHLLARSPDHVIQQADLNHWFRFTFSGPLPRVRGTFFAGLAQPAPPPGQQFYPIATQAEPYIRSDTYYIAPGDSALLGLVPPQPTTRFGRMMISVELGSAPLATPAGPAAPPTLTVYPNPATGPVLIRLPTGSSWRQITLRDLLGRLHWSASVTTALQPLDVAHLPNGLYLLQLLDDHGHHLQQRLLVQH